MRKSSRPRRLSLRFTASRKDRVTMARIGRTIASAITSAEVGSIFLLVVARRRNH